MDTPSAPDVSLLLAHILVPVVREGVLVGKVLMTILTPVPSCAIVVKMTLTCVVRLDK